MLYLFEQVKIAKLLALRQVEDIGEKNDLSAEYPELLNEMVAEAELWSSTHVQPQWFHDEKTGVEWRSDNMPRFEETFKMGRK